MSASLPLQFNPVDPEAKAAVDLFLKPANPVMPTTPVEEPLEPSREFDMPTAGTIMSSGLVDERLMQVTDADKHIYLKSLLTETPLELDIPLFNGQLVLTIRSRTLWDQQMITDILHADFYAGKELTISPNEVDRCAHVNQQYLAAIMVRKINGITFSDVDLGQHPLAECRKLMEAFILSKLVGMQAVKWTAIANAIRIFESKSARMATEANNDSFWPPRS